MSKESKSSLVLLSNVTNTSISPRNIGILDDIANSIKSKIVSSDQTPVDLIGQNNEVYSKDSEDIVLDYSGDDDYDRRLEWISQKLAVYNKPTSCKSLSGTVTTTKSQASSYSQ